VTKPEKKSAAGGLGWLFGASPAKPEADTPPPVDEAQAALEDPRAGSAARAETARPEPVDAPAPAAPVASTPQAQRGWFSRLTDGLTKTSRQLTSGLTGLFTKSRLDQTSLDDLEDILIAADLGSETARQITGRLGKGRFEKGITQDDVRTVLADEVARVLAPVAKPLVVDVQRKPHVILVVGVNGTGKTTTIGKLAGSFRRQGHRVLLAAGDTFRAAAIEQLGVWGERTGARVVSRPAGADSAGLAFDALTEAKAEGYDVAMIDTAGRLQNKATLMDELDKVLRVVRKVDPTAPHDVLLVLDATTGQNALQQVAVFGERAGVTGLVMTKLDGTARGGILVAIAAKFGLPIHAIGVGEGVDDLQPFDPQEFAVALAGPRGP
jgi:fused signal recognition particle receptor